MRTLTVHVKRGGRWRAVGAVRIFRDASGRTWLSGIALGHKMAIW